MSETNGHRADQLTGNPAEPAAFEAPGAADNTEWQLDELIDALATAVDRAEDTLALKANGRGIAFAVKQLGLHLRVSARRAPDGSVRFRTLPEGAVKGSLLDIDLQQMLGSQLAEARELPPNEEAAQPVSTLPDIDAEEIGLLAGVGVHTVADLRRYADTVPALTELARKTGVREARLRRWHGLPWLDRATPASAPPTAVVLLEGGNLGAAPDGTGQVLIGGVPAAVDSWGDARIAARVPAATEPGAIRAIVGGQPTNALDWSPVLPDLSVHDIVATPEEPLSGDEVTFDAVLVNGGNGTSPPFSATWSIDGGGPEWRRHGALEPGQRSAETGTRITRRLTAGLHTVVFAADPNATLPDAVRANGVFKRTIEVRPLTQLRLGLVGPLPTLDPLRASWRDHGELLGLVFRGLQQVDPRTGAAEPDMAAEVRLEAGASNEVLTVVRLDPRARFHDGTPLRAAHVQAAYRAARELQTPWTPALNLVDAIDVRDELTLAFHVRGTSEPGPLTLPIAFYVAGRPPLGSGPFAPVANQAAEFELHAVRDHLSGAPRIERILVSLAATPAELAGDVRGRRCDVAVLPYDPALATELGGKPVWNVTPLPAKAPVLLDVESTRLRERWRSASGTAWHAAFWELR